MDSPVLILVGFIAVFLLLVVIASVLRGKQVDRQSAWAGRRNLRYIEASFEGFDRDDHGEFSWLLETAPFGEGHSRQGYDRFTGVLSGTKFDAFTYRYQTGSGDDKKSASYGVAIFELPLRLPRMGVNTRGSSFEVPDVQFESEEFNRKFSVGTDNERAAFDLFHPTAMELLIGGFNKGSWQIVENHLLWVTYSSWDCEEYDSMAHVVSRFVELIPHYMIKDLA